VPKTNNVDPTIGLTKAVTYISKIDSCDRRIKRTLYQTLAKVACILLSGTIAHRGIVVLLVILCHKTVMFLFFLSQHVVVQTKKAITAVIIAIVQALFEYLD